MNEPVIPSKGELDPTKRIFLSPGFLQILDRDRYGLFRQLFVQVTKDDGTVEREKAGKPVGPIDVFREKRPEDPPESVVMRTHHPHENRELQLVKVIE